jgi:hypothetical protein
MQGKVLTSIITLGLLSSFFYFSNVVRAEANKPKKQMVDLFVPDGLKCSVLKDVSHNDMGAKLFMTPSKYKEMGKRDKEKLDSGKWKIADLECFDVCSCYALWEEI